VIESSTSRQYFSPIWKWKENTKRVGNCCFKINSNGKPYLYNYFRHAGQLLKCVKYVIAMRLITGFRVLVHQFF
jgi:hypothetical protein